MKKKNKSLLWRVEDTASLVGPSFIFGTMHVRDKRAFEFLEQIFKYIQQSNAFATEFNLEEAQHAAHADMLTLPNGLTLDQLMVPKKYRKLEKYFKKITGLDLQMLNNSQPLLITNFMSERILASDMAVSLDETLWRFARKEEKILLGIESFEEQVHILKQIPLDKQVKALLGAVKNIKSFRYHILKMTKVYQTGDIGKLYQMGKKSIGGLRKILLYRRNEIMATRLAGMFGEQTVFAAVGAAHLGGQKGLLKLLKQEGFQVRPITYKLWE